MILLRDLGCIGKKPSELVNVCGVRSTTQPDVRGQRFDVETSADLRAAVDGVGIGMSPGDTLCIASGTYNFGADTGDGTLIMRERNCEGVLIMPEPGGTVVITGDSKIILAARQAEIYGLQVTDLTSLNISGSFIRIQGDGTGFAHDSKIWGCVFSDTTNKSCAANTIYIDVRSNDVEVCDCQFIDSSAVGVNVTVTAPPGASLSPMRTHAHHCSYIRGNTSSRVMNSGGGVWQDWNPPYDGWELNGLFEYWKVQDLVSDANAELFALKSSGNVCRFNYIENSGACGLRMNVREGHRNRFYGNVMIADELADRYKFAYSVQGDDNIFAGNYVQGDGTATAVGLAVDCGDEDLPIGRNAAALRTVIMANIFDDGFNYGYAPATGKSPINSLPRDTTMSQNYFANAEVVAYNAAATEIGLEAISELNPGIVIP